MPIDLKDVPSLRPRILLLVLAVAAIAPASTPALALPVSMPDLAPAMSGTPTVSAGSDSALVSASVTPGSIGTTWSIQYGTSDGYGTSTPPQTLAAGIAPVAVNASLGGLAADATYHYRFALMTALATTYSADATFATSTALVTLSDPGPVQDDDPPTTTEAEGHQDEPGTAVPRVVAPPATNTTTTPARTSTPAPARTTAAADTTVAARLTAATATRDGVKITLRTSELTTVRVTIRPGGGARATTKTYRSLRAGAHPFTIRTHLKTTATVTVTATDRAGNTLTITRRLKPRLQAATRRA